MRNGKRTSMQPLTPHCRPRRGFTLLEMITVIGIIMLLMAMAVIGYRYVEAKSSKDRTLVFLHNAAGLVAELDRTGQLYRLEGAGGAAYAPGATLAAPGDVSNSGAGRTTAVGSCQKVISILQQTQANQTALGQWPAKGLANNAGGTPFNPPVLADGWGNPMIWVPSGGLTGVKLGSKANAAGTITYANGGITITSPDGRGFWASAGPDGDFSTGDDNIYSFEP